ncbi:MAG: hypothetical protein D6794_03190 [Deltaproteobacteria bacterium]|nr:MAG: hypothetical protein D6794_03190 [Deltaproteobacteria bacterium]
MLRYCGWCGTYLGANRAQGYQIAVNLCAIDTTGICPACLKQMQGLLADCARDRDHPPDSAIFAGDS